MADSIAVDGDAAQQNATALYQVAGELPSSGSVSVVLGNTSDEPAAVNLTTHLTDRARELSVEVEKIRSFVALNSDALRSAVEALQSTDQMNAADAASMSSLIDMSLTTPPSTPESPQSSPSGPQSSFFASRAQ